MRAAEVGLRPLEPGDRAAARALADAELLRSPYGALPETALATALGAGSDEARAIVALSGGQVIGLIVFGMVAGAIGTGRLHLVAVSAGSRRSGIGSALVAGAVARLASDGARVIFAELPDDPVLAPAQALLRRAGFNEEARVADLFRDGVALMALRRDVE